MKPVMLVRIFFYLSLMVYGVAYSLPSSLTTISSSINKKEPSISVYLEHYKLEEIDFNSSKFFFTSKNEEITFLNNYYSAGMQGSRAELLELYEPNLQIEIRKKYLTSISLKNEFIDLKLVKLIKALYWGNYRFILVEHTNRLNNERYTWIHSIKCASGKCLFHEKPELVQVAAYIFYQEKINPSLYKNIAAVNAIQLKMYSENEKNTLIQNIDNFPVVINIHDVDDPLTIERVKKLFQSLLKFSQNSQINSLLANDLFDNKVPKSYPLKNLKDELNVYAYDAFIRILKNQTDWKFNRIFYGNNDTIILTATSSSGVQMILPIRLVAGQYKILTDYQRDNFWPIFETVQFSAAWNKLIGIK